jgi:hypothetical protein
MLLFAANSSTCVSSLDPNGIYYSWLKWAVVQTPPIRSTTLAERQPHQAKQFLFDTDMRAVIPTENRITARDDSHGSWRYSAEHDLDPARRTVFRRSDKELG